MAAIKTAISLDKRLFEQMDKMARRRRMPRSRLFAQAVREFLKKHEGKDLTDRINRAYAEGESEEVRASFRRSASQSMRRLLEGSW